LLKVLGLLKSFIVAIFRLPIKTLRVVLRFFYYQSVVPLYRLYLLLFKKFGLSRFKRHRRLTAILINKKLIHFLFIVLVISGLYNNFLKTEDNLSSEEVVGKTLLAKIVSDEFVQAEELIEVGPSDYLLSARPAADYWSENTFLRPLLAIDYDMSDISDQVAAVPGSVQAPSRSGVVEYAVKAGDTIGGIARYFGISVNTILWENNLTAKSYIKPGDKLRILPTSGVRHAVARGENLASIAKQYGVTTSDIMSANDLANANQIKIGQQLIIPGANKAAAASGVASVSRQSRSLAAIITGQGASAEPVAGSKMNWPVRGTITQYYSWRHNGLDIANKTGTPIYAAAAGTVTEATWNAGGYGYYIIIDHGGGLKTRYAHLSKFATRVGDQVAKGQNIGFVGSTGNSTGPHLHFEVMVYGRRYNPFSYLY